LEVLEPAVVVLVFLAVYTDLRWRRIPNVLTVSGALAGLALNMIILGPTEGLRIACLGLVVGLALLLPFFALGGMGGGDVKLLAALGAWVGPGRVFNIFLYAALAGGIASIIMLALQGRRANFKEVAHDVLFFFLTQTCQPERRDGPTLAYSLPIAAGVLGAIVFGDLV